MGISLGEAQKMMGNANSGGNFSDNVRLPFFKPKDGKTRIIILSREEESEDGIPSIEVYQSYNIGNVPPYERSYQDGDELDPMYLSRMESEGKTPNPSRFAFKGFAYIFNLTAYNAMRVLEKKKSLARGDFGGDLNEKKAAEAYMQDTKSYPRSGDSPFEGFMVYNFNTTIFNGIVNYKQMMEEESEEADLRAYIFDLSKTGTGTNTSYNLSPGTPIEELDENVQEHIDEFIEENEFGDFSYLIDNKRYVNEESVEEENSFDPDKFAGDEKEINTNW